LVELTGEWMMMLFGNQEWNDGMKEGEGGGDIGGLRRRSIGWISKHPLPTCLAFR
jgi:hypothetical protein